MIKEIVKKLIGNKKSPEPVAVDVMINSNKIPRIFKESSRSDIMPFFLDHTVLPVLDSNNEIIGGYSIHNFLGDMYSNNISSKFSQVGFIVSKTDLDTIHSMLFEQGISLLVVVDGVGSPQGFITKNIFFEFFYDNLVRFQVLKFNEKGTRIGAEVHFNQIRHLLELPSLDSLHSSITIGGRIMEYLGRIPSKNEIFKVDGYTIQVTQGNSTNITELLFTKLS